MWAFLTAILLTGCSTPANPKSAKASMEPFRSYAFMGQFDKAAGELDKLSQTGQFSPELIRRASLALDLSELAQELAPWRGSDFGAAPPWLDTEESWFAKPGSGGNTLSLVKPGTAYFDRIIDHSLSRLKTKASIARK